MAERHALSGTERQRPYAGYFTRPMTPAPAEVFDALARGPVDARLALKTNLLIDNREIPAANGGTFRRLNPVDGGLVTEAAAATVDDARRAIESAAAAFPAWAALGPNARRDVLMESARWCAWCASTASRRRSASPTTPNTGCRRRSSPATSRRPCRWPSGSTSAAATSTGRPVGTPAE